VALGLVHNGIEEFRCDLGELRLGKFRHVYFCTVYFMQKLTSGWVVYTIGPQDWTPWRARA
jgi:hypothetical protein